MAGSAVYPTRFFLQDGLHFKTAVYPLDGSARTGSSEGKSAGRSRGRGRRGHGWRSAAWLATVLKAMAVTSSHRDAEFATFLASSVALLVAQVASLKVFARFRGGGASCAGEDGGAGWAMTVGVAGTAATGLAITGGGGAQFRQGWGWGSGGGSGRDRNLLPHVWELAVIALF